MGAGTGSGAQAHPERTRPPGPSGEPVATGELPQEDRAEVQNPVSGEMLPLRHEPRAGRSGNPETERAAPEAEPRGQTQGQGQAEGRGRGADAGYQAADAPVFARREPDLCPRGQGQPEEARGGDPQARGVNLQEGHLDDGGRHLDLR